MKMLIIIATLLLCSAGYAENAKRIEEHAEIGMLQSVKLDFDLASVPKGQQVRLMLEARIDSPDLGGNTPAIGVSVNGRGVEGRMLLNKPLKFTMREGSLLDWSTKDSNSYRLMYSPDFSDRIKTDEGFVYGLYEEDQDPYKFVWDISDLVVQGKNTLTLESNSGLSFLVVVRNIGFETGKPLKLINGNPVATAAPKGKLSLYMPVSRNKAPEKIYVSDSGNLRWRFGGRVYSLDSKTSLPEGKWSEGNQTGWTALKSGAEISRSQRFDSLKVHRTIRLSSGKISIKDTYTNTGDQLLGVILENRLMLPEPAKEVMLCGAGGDMQERTNPAHPTVLVQFKEAAAGIAVEDDISRFHGVFFKENNAIGFADRSLGLPEKKSIALQWSIYTLPGGDYWDFVNALRRDWGANFTLHGSLVLPPPDICNYLRGVNFTSEELKAWLAESGNSIKRIMTHVAVHPDRPMATATKEAPAFFHGTAILDAKAWQDNTRQLVKEIKKADPSVRVYAYSHKNLCTEIGYCDKYRDSVAMDSVGNEVKSIFAPAPGLFVPLQGNSYGKAMMDVYRLLAEDLGADIYIDEINNDYLVPGDGKSYWDGCTVVIDPKTHSVLKKQSIPGLLVLPWLSDLMEYLHSKGKLVYFNGYITSRSMLDWGKRGFLQTSVEDGMGLSAISNLHLGTPLAWAGYLNGRPGYNHFHESIGYGGVPFTYSGIWNQHVFPFTPVSLNSGVIIGKERILTTKSGLFGWNDRSSAEVFVYDGTGKLVQKPLWKSVLRGEKRFVELRMPSDHSAVLVRKK